MRLHVVLVHPARDAAAVADLVPGDGGRVLAQDSILRGRATGDGGHHAVTGASPGPHVEPGRGRGLQAQLRRSGRRPGNRHITEITVRLYLILVYPARDRGAVADLPPGSGGGVLAQDIVLGGAARGDERPHPAVPGGLRKNLDFRREGSCPAHLWEWGPSHGQLAQVTFGLHMGGRDPARDAGAVADLPPGSGGGVLAQDIVLRGRTAANSGQDTVRRAGAGAHIEASRSGDPQLGPGPAHRGHRSPRAYLAGLHPAPQGLIELDLPPSGRLRLLPANAEGSRAVVGNDRHHGCVCHRSRMQEYILFLRRLREGRSGGRRRNLRYHRHTAEVAVRLHMVAVDPARLHGCILNLPPHGTGSAFLAHNPVPRGGSGRQGAHCRVRGAGALPDGESCDVAGNHTDLGRPEDRHIVRMVGLHLAGLHPGTEVVIQETDAPPGGRGRVLAQNGVAAGGVRDSAVSMVRGAGAIIYIQICRGGLQGAMGLCGRRFLAVGCSGLYHGYHRYIGGKGNRITRRHGMPEIH